MVDASKQIITTLSSILPVSYELFLDDNDVIPMITYIEHDNIDNKTCETFGYSDVTFLIKVWTDNVSDMQTYSKQVDAAMRGIGYKRTNSQEVVVDNIIQKWLTYKGLGIESYI